MQEKVFEAAVWGSSWEEADTASTIGTASFSNDKGPQIEVPYGSLLADTKHYLSEDPPRADYLYGISRVNDYIVAFDCDGYHTQYHIPGVEKQTIRAEWMMRASRRFDPASSIIELRSDLKGLLEWSGRDLVHEQAKYDSEMRFLESTALLDSHSLDSLPLYECDDYSIALHFTSVHGSKQLAETIYRNKATLVVRFDEPVDLSTATRLLNRLQLFFSFCCGWYSAVESVRLVTTDETRVDYYCRYICDDKVLSRSDFEQMPLPYSKISETVGDTLAAWLNASEKLTAAINVLVPLSTKSMDTFLDLQFLAAAQTLEALACEGRSVQNLSKEEFDRRLGIIKSIEDKQTREWAYGRLSGSGSNRIGQRRLLSDLYDDVGDFADKVFPNKKKFIDAHVQMRNDIVHRNPESLSIDHSRLYYHMQGVVVLCYAAVMRKLGFSSNEVPKFFEDSRFRSFLIDKAAHLY